MQVWHKLLKIFYSNPKFGQISPKTKILLDLLEYLDTSKFEGNKNKYDSNENSHTSQFEDSEYKSDIIKGFFKFKFKFAEIFVQYSNFVRWHENLLSS